MKKWERTNAGLPKLPPARRRTRPTRAAGRRNDLLRRGVLSALAGSRRYTVVRNMRVPVTAEARAAVHRANGGYVGVSLPADEGSDTVVLDMVVVDEGNAWAGGYSFCSDGAQSPQARRRVADDLRAAELTLRDHLSGVLDVEIKTVVVGIIDGGPVDLENADDLTIPAHEIAGHFEVTFRDPDGPSFAPTGEGPAA